MSDRLALAGGLPKVHNFKTDVPSDTYVEPPARVKQTGIKTL